MVHWGVNKVDNKQVCFDNNGRLKPVTVTIIHCCALLGVSEITNQNAAEVYRRIALFEEREGVGCHEQVPGQLKLAPRPITLEDVKAHVGLWTSATALSAAKFDGLWGNR